MVVELVKDSRNQLLDKIDASKKLVKEAKKAEKEQKKLEKKASKTSRKEGIKKAKKEIADFRESQEKLQAEFNKEVEVRGIDLRTWPIEIIIKYRTVCPYDLYGIEIPDEAEDEKDEPETEFTFDPQKGFTPTVIPEPILVKPFNINENMVLEEKPIQGDGISDEDFANLEKVFNPLLKGQKYRYESYNDIFMLYITRVGGTEESFIIDDGSILGGDKFYVLANKMNDTVFVSADDPEIPMILKSKFYMVSPDCAKRNEANLLQPGIVYRYIDFSGIDLDKVDKDKFAANLAACINVVSNNGEAPRMRFNEFTSDSNFELISDEFTKSPLQELGFTSNLISPMLRIEFENNKIAVYNAETLTAQYTITAQ